VSESVFLIGSQEEEEALRVKQEEERFEAEEKARSAKRPRHEDLVLHKLVEQDPEDISTLDDLLKAVVNEPHPRRIGDFDAFVYDADTDTDKRDAREVEQLKKKFRSLKIVARAKVNQNRIYCAAYHPEVSKDLIFFGGMLVSLAGFNFFFSCLYQINMVNWVSGMQERHLMKLRMRMGTLKLARVKVASIGDCNVTGQLPRSRRYPVSDLTRLMRIL
jgi:hypothetical protein